MTDSVTVSQDIEFIKVCQPWVCQRKATYWICHSKSAYWLSVSKHTELAKVLLTVSQHTVLLICHRKSTTLSLSQLLSALSLAHKVNMLRLSVSQHIQIVTLIQHDEFVKTKSVLWVCRSKPYSVFPLFCFHSEVNTCMSAMTNKLNPCQAFTHTVHTSTTVYPSFHTHNHYFHYLCTSKLSQTQSLLEPLLCGQAFTHTILTSTTVYPSFHTHNPYFHNCVSELSHTQSLLPQLCIQACGDGGHAWHTAPASDHCWCSNGLLSLSGWPTCRRIITNIINEAYNALVPSHNNQL